MEISATIYSAIQALDEQGKEVEMMEILTTDDYSGINEMRHAKDDKDEDLFFNKGDLGHTHGVKYCAGQPKLGRIETPLLLGKQKPSRIATPMLFTDAHELNPGCIECGSASGCARHSDVVSKRSWVIDDTHLKIIPCTSQPMMEMLYDFLVSEKDAAREGQSLVPTDNESSDVSGGADVASRAAPPFAEEATKAGLVVYEKVAKEEAAEPPGGDQRTQAAFATATMGQKSLKKGLLALVATNPRVTATGNIVEQAICIQNVFRATGNDFVAVVATGTGVYFRFPGCDDARFIRGSLKTMSEIIEAIDKSAGLETPIIIFGYSRMRRSVSFRSSNRVPTHMILSRGGGYSLEDYIQALGRATFNGLSILIQNGHSGVTILTDKNDFLAAKKYYSFVQAINVMLRENRGMTLVRALRVATKKLPDEANFFRHTNRKVGRRKDLKYRDPPQDAFADQSISKDDENKKARYWEDTVVQRVFKIFLEEADGNKEFSCSATTILAAYSDLYPAEDDEDTLTLIGLTKTMIKLARDEIFENIRKGGKQEWSAKSLHILEFMHNESLDEPDDGDDMD
jgi:hypothetical protein